MKQASSLRKFLKSLFHIRTITFIAGIILGTVIQIFLEKPILNSLIFLLIFFSIYLSYTVITIEKTNSGMYDIMNKDHENAILQLQRLSKETLVIAQSLGLNIRWIPNPSFEEDKGYELSLDIVKKAEKSVYIISDYSPQDRPITYTKERGEYLSAIGRVVNEHITHNDQFEYKRILQSDRADDVHRVIERRHLEGDEQTFNHCGEVISSIQSKRTAVTVQFFVSKPIPSAPSVLLVDHRYILFTIPGKKGAIDSNSVDHADLATFGVLYIEDYNGKLAADFKKMFDTFAADSKPIANVER